MTVDPVADPVLERFRGSHGTALGWIVVAFGLAVCVRACMNFDFADNDVVAALGLLLAAVGWGAMVRPALWATRDHLVMRGMVMTVAVPLAAIESYGVRQFLVVHAGDRRHTSSVLGRKRRSRLGRAVDPMETPPPVQTKLHEMDPADHFEERLGALTEEARTREGIRLASQAQLDLGKRTRGVVDVVPAVLVAVPVVLLVLAIFVN